MKVSFQRTKTGDFYTHHFKVVLACCDFKTINWNQSLEDYLQEKQLFPNFTDSCIKSFLNKLYTPTVIVQSVSKRNVYVKLLFLGSASFQIQKKLKKLFTDKLTSSNLKIVFTSHVRLKSFFTLKDKLPKMLLSELVYKFKCSGCIATYYGMTPFLSLNLWTFRHLTFHWEKGKNWK